MKIGLITLGCDKNTVDMEYLAGLLTAHGHEILTEGALTDMDVLVLHTCGFVADARDQSFDTLRSALDAKTRLGNPRRVVVSGCLSQRLGDILRHDYPGIDAVAGVGRIDTLASIVERTGQGDPAPDCEVARPPDMRMPAPLPRRPVHSAGATYLRIADGCDHRCAFCAIPAIKGPYRSVAREILIAETHDLLARGAREINLIAQDLAPYGRDLYGADYGITQLLQDICRIEGDFWVRLLYLYPAGLTDRFLDTFAREPKIVKYLDVPFQHLDADVLKRMGRPGGDVAPADAVARIRKAVPDATIRTTLIVGHPGETPRAFRRLIEGIETLRFDRLGAFVFSPEEGTRSADMPDRIPRKTAEQRIDRLMETQAQISAETQARLIGRRIRVLVEETADDGSEAIGRCWRDAPEVDGEVLLTPGPDAGPTPTPGSFVDARVTGADVYDLEAQW